MRSFVQWAAPLPDGGTSEENALVFSQANETTLLVLPALFDEANKMRRQTVEVMHRLSLSGVDCVLPDLPGCHESLAPMQDQTLENWREAVGASVEKFAPTHVLTVRSGALLAPQALPGWRYAPSGGDKLIRSMLRARTIAAQESGVIETIDGLSQKGRAEGIVLAGWALNARMFSALADARTPPCGRLSDISQDTVGGAGLWLRAEPDEDPEQADALAAIIAIGLAER